MKKRITILLGICFLAFSAMAQTVVVLELPDPCPNAVEEDGVSSFDFFMSPNPAHDRLTLTFADMESLGDIEFTLTSTSGIVLLKEKFHTSENQLNVDINIGDLAAGIYVVSAKCKEFYIVRKTIKQ